MKVTLDLDDLVSKGKLTAAEADRLKLLSSQDAGSLGINIILAFGVVAVVSGAGVLFPYPLTGIVLGGLLFAGGLALMLRRSEAWTLLARVCITVGALIFCGGLTFYTGTSALALGLMSVGIGGVALISRSGLLATLAVLGLGGALINGYGAAGAIWGIFSPSMGTTIVVFGVLGLALLLISMRLPPVYERLAIIAARTAALVANLVLLFASIFGDSQFGIPGSAFALVWAILLIGAAVWGANANRRWVVNTAAVFGGLHFFVQWFFYLGANPLTVFGGGILLVVFAMALWNFNRRRFANRPDAGLTAAVG